MSGFTSLQSAGVLAQSAVAVPHTGDTVAATLATITIPANALGANGSFEVKASFSFPNSTNTKTLSIRFGGTLLFSTIQGTGSAGVDIIIRVCNRNSPSSQRSSGFLVSTAGAATLIVNTAAIDTTQNADITIAGQLALGTETVTLESYQVVLYPKG